ncbi:MAG: hypothetical protein HFJ38_08150 [Bacilli bacterium]|nr:hypothetical protein [Bacilli bacterium]
MMADEEYVNFIIEERISLLLQRQRGDFEVEMMDKIRAGLNVENSETRLEIETYLNLLIDQIAQSEIKLYLEALKDGIWLSKWIERQESRVMTKE